MRLITFSFLLFFCVCAHAQRNTEEISHFSVDIYPREDASLDVRETLTVVATGDQIRRGITRALHVKPLGTDNDLAPFSYEVESVSRDGVTEPYSVRTRKGLPTIYIGDKDVRLDPGTYTYEIRYRAVNQVYAVGATDEIRWPLEGNSGSLPVRDADITIHFDRALDIIQSACYTGTFGSTAEDCEFSQDGHVVTFVATRPLQPGEGMTVSASIAQGYFSRPVPPPPPTPFERRAVLYVMVTGLSVAAAWAYSLWRKYGVDPKAPAVDYVYHPPEGLSPAAVSYLSGTGGEQQRMTASLTALAIAGLVDIREEKTEGIFGGSEYFKVMLTGRQPTPGELPAEQKGLYDGIAAAGGLTLDGEYNKAVELLTKAHRECLVGEHKTMAKDGTQFTGLLPLSGLLAVTIGLGIYFLATTGIGATAFAIGVILAAVLLVVYTVLIQQPSLAKVTLLSRIRALRKYLKLSEKKRAQLPGAPAMNEEYFRSVLPYAIALGVENNWAADLAADWAASGARAREGGALGMAPYMSAGFGSRFGSTYSKTAVNPASSASGGGFSGGGGSVGGGGGTGGW